MKIDWRSSKEEVRGPSRQPEGCLVRPPPDRARHPPECLVAPLGAPFLLYKPPGEETPKEDSFSCFSAATGGNLERRKAISDGQIPPGRSPPGRGDLRHHHHHRHGHP